MAFELPPLPFDKNDLLPAMSPETFEYHHGRHHRSYVENANKLLAGSPLEGKSVEEVVKAASGKPELQGLFNNAAQHFNHSFFWKSLVSVNRSVAIPTSLREAIVRDFGAVDEFKKQFVAAGMAQFGSGWVWLVLDAGKLAIVRTANAETPITSGKIPLLVCDVWEHAYYIDYRNARQKYLDTFTSGMINWVFAGDNLAKAK